MMLRLDPRIAIVWRDPFSLQFGVDPARVVLRETSIAEERMIAALASGISRSGLGMIAEASGAPSAADNLLRRLAPVLVESSTPTAAPLVSLVGSGMSVDAIADALAHCGVRVTVAPRATEGGVGGATRSAAPRAGGAGAASSLPLELGIAVGHYVLDPDSYGYWLRRDLPHLPVIFGDDTVQIGPLVEPGLTACLYCLEHHRRDADGSWSAIASQLWGRRSAAETPLVSREVAALVARMVTRRLDSGRDVRAGVAAAASFRLSVETGELQRREWMPHPDCGCLRLPGVETGVETGAETGPTASLRETGWPRGSDRPTTPEDALEPA